MEMLVLKSVYCLLYISQATPLGLDSSSACLVREGGSLTENIPQVFWFSFLDLLIPVCWQ